MIYPTDCTLLRLSALAAEPRAVEHSMPHNMCHAWLDRIGQRILQSVRVLLAVVHACKRLWRPSGHGGSMAVGFSRSICVSPRLELSSTTGPIRSDSISDLVLNRTVLSLRIKFSLRHTPSVRPPPQPIRSVGLDCTVSAHRRTIAFH